MKSFTKSAKGAFTLIEMLIVVAIIGILVGLGVPALRDAKAQARQAKIDSAVCQVATAKDRYALDNAAVVAGSTVTFANIAPYITVKGQAVSAITDLLPADYGTITVNPSGTAPSFTP